MSQVIQASAGLSDQTGRGYQQHLAYLINSGKWLLAWQDSSSATVLKFLTNSTPDFTTGIWSAPTGSPYTLATSFSNDGTNRSGAHHHLTYKNISGNDVLHLEQGVYSFGFRFTAHLRGHVSGSTITIDADTGSIYGGGNSSPQGLGGTLASNNAPAAVWDGSLTATGFVSANADSGSSWSSSDWGSALTGFGATTNDPNGLCVWPLASGKLVALYEDASAAEPNSMQNVFYSLYNGSIWGVGASVGFSALGAGVDPNNFGAVNCGGSDVHCVLRTGANTFSHRRYNGTSWSAGSSIPNQTSKAGAGLAMASDGTNVWLVIIDSDVANTVRFIRWTSAGWDATWTAIETSSKTRNCVSVANVPGSSVLGVIWTETNGATFDIAGSTITLGQLAPFADWPVPKGRIPATSLKTHLQSTPLNLVGKDLMYGAAGQPRTQTDQPLPPRGRPFPASNRGFVQGSSALLLTPPIIPGGMIRNSDWAVPRGRAFPVALRTHLGALNLQLIGKDQFFGAPGQPPANHDFPVPKGRTPPIVNRTHVQGVRLNLIGQDTFYAAAGQPPANQDFPNPRGRAAAIALRTFIQQTPLNLVGKDTFFGLAGQPPENHDFPVPRGRTPAISLRTHVQPTPLNLLGQDTFYAGAGVGPKYDWPNPRGRAFPTSLRTHTQEVKQNLIGQDAFGPGGSVTRAWVPSDLGTALIAWYKADSLALNDGDSVSSWPDSSGNGHTATQGTANLRPAFKVGIQNGLPVVRFSTTGPLGQTNLSAPLTLAQPFQMFLIAKPTLADTTQIVWLGSLIQFGQGFVTGASYIYGGASLLLDNDSATWKLREATFNGASSEYRFDGGTPDTGNVGTGGITGSLTIGDFATMDILEIIITTALSTADRQNVEGYADWRAGIQTNLPGGHPYANAAPTFTLSTSTMLYATRPDNRDWPVPRGRQRATSLLSLQVGYNPSLYPPIAFPSLVVMAQGYYIPPNVLGYFFPSKQGQSTQNSSGQFPDKGT